MYNRQYHRNYHYEHYVSIKMFREHPENFNESEITMLCSRQKLSFKFLKEMKDHLNWIVLSRTQDFTDEMIEEFKDYINWQYLCRWNRKFKFREEFAEKYADYVDWEGIGKTKHISKEFVLRHIDRMDANSVFGNYNNYSVRTAEVLDAFLKKDRNSYNWFNSISETFPLNFIREYVDVINFSRIMQTSVMAYGKKFVDEFHKFFKKDDWKTLEHYLYYFDFDFIIKYSDYWTYDKYTNPVNYHSFRGIQLEGWQKEVLKELWEKNSNK